MSCFLTTSACRFNVYLYFTLFYFRFHPNQPGFLCIHPVLDIHTSFLCVIHLIHRTTSPSTTAPSLSTFPSHIITLLSGFYRSTRLYNTQESPTPDVTMGELSVIVFLETFFPFLFFLISFPTYVSFLVATDRYIMGLVSFPIEI